MGWVWTDSIDEVLKSDVDVVVELVGGLDPAGEWVWGALKAGKSVVTANKEADFAALGLAGKAGSREAWRCFTGGGCAGFR